MKLFSVFLGGEAPKCNTELHDVVFAVGKNIESTYLQLLDKWFGTPQSLHIDSWFEVKSVDGYKIKLSKKKEANSKKLFFVNLGGYDKNIFGELHTYTLCVASKISEAKKISKKKLLHDAFQVHTDNIFEVDICFPVEKVNGYYINLEFTGKEIKHNYNNEYHKIPKEIISFYLLKKLK